MRSMISAVASKTAGIKKLSSQGIDRIKTKGRKIAVSIKSGVSKMTGIKRWEQEIKKCENAHEFLTDYYRDTNHPNIEYGAFGLIDLKKLQKHNFNDLFVKLSNKKYDKSHMKSAFKLLKIRFSEIKDKTHGQIVRRIEDGFHSVYKALTEKIDDYRTNQKERSDKKRNENIEKQSAKVEVFPRSVPRVVN